MPDDSSQTTSDGSDLKRRAVLSTAASATAVVGLSGVASAATPDVSAADDATVRAAFESEAGELADHLAAEGVLDDPADLLDAVEAGDTRVGVVEEQGAPTRHFQVTVETDAGEVDAVVHEATGRAYAVRRGDEDVDVIDPAVGGSTAASTCGAATTFGDKECRYASCDGWRNIFVSGAVFEEFCYPCDGETICSWSNTGDCCSPY
jgi:hypothetical protein